MSTESMLTAAPADVHVCVPPGRPRLVRIIDATEAILSALAGWEEERNGAGMTPYALRERIPAHLRCVGGLAWRLLEEEGLVRSRVEPHVEGPEFDFFIWLTPEGRALLSYRSAAGLAAVKEVS